MQTTKERLLEFLSYLNVGQTVFEKKVGISNGYINNLKGSIGPAIINKISDVYPELNSEWLLNGKGEMLKPEARKEPPAQLELDFSTIVKANADMAAACKDSASAAVEAARAARMLAEESKSVLTQLTNSLSRLEKKIDEKIEGGTVSEPRSML